jgi:hypothetical protein
MTSTGFFERIADKSERNQAVTNYLKQDENWEYNKTLNRFKFYDKTMFLKDVTDEDIIKAIEEIGGKKVEILRRAYDKIKTIGPHEYQFYVRFKD